MRVTEEKLLREKENAIKTHINRGDVKFVNTFNFLRNHYALKNWAGKAPVLPVFEAIYIKNVHYPAWKLALYCNVSRSTLFNYRNAIINDFYLCLNENLLTEEIAITKENDK